jgi:polar amino acid transport system substrate-binding protein
MTEIAKNGVLRAAINTGNRALVRVGEDGTLGGISPALARRLAAEIGAELEPVVYDGAGKVFADAGAGVWDVGFLAIDPARATRVSFTRPYHVIEATLAVRAASGIDTLEEWDREGRTIVTSLGSAYELFLTANTRAATLAKGGTPGESFERFRSGEGDMVAGVRQSLERHFGGDPEFRVLPGTLTKVEQAIVLPAPDHPGIGALDDFVKRAIDEGFVARELQA